MTAALAAVLAAAGVLISLPAPIGPILGSPVRLAGPLLFAWFVVLFVGAEIGLLHVELRRHTSSFSLTSAVLVSGVLECDTRLVVAARLVAALLVFTAQRLPPLKVAYNLSSYLLEVALLGVALHAVLDHRDRMTPGPALLCLLVVAGIEVLMSSFVLLVISWHQGGMSWEQALAVYVPCLALAAANTVTALTGVTLLTAGAMGGALIAVLTVLMLLLYRGYLRMRRRHLSLAVVHQFVEQGVGPTSVEELAAGLLTRTRRLLNAACVELVVVMDGRTRIRRVGEDDAFTSYVPEDGTGARADEALIEQVRREGGGLVIHRGVREHHLRQWLRERQVRDAMIVSLPGDGADGVLLVTDRLGENSTFTLEDLTLLQTLAGHMVVSLRGARLVEQLRYDATHDALTGLANRVLLISRTDACLADGREARVLLLDLDKFKEVNDALGHHVGDEMLSVVAARIESCVPAGSTVARLGGDEFAVLLPMAGPPQPEAVAREILAALTNPITVTEAVLTTRASVGIAVGSGTLTSSDLLRQADTAMYAAKAGPTPVVRYTEDLDRGRVERLTLLAELHAALERDELVLYYQPQLDVRTDEVVSAEALVRWQHPQRGLVPPDLFIPLAESSGLIEQLTAKVLTKALQQNRIWRDLGLDLVVAVNMSAHNLKNENLAQDVAAALAAAGLPADRLVLEITESVVMDDPVRSVAILQALADIGVTLSLDDFGTGFSSMAYLQRLPVDELKIDKSFVTGLAPRPDADASPVLIRTMITMADNLGLRVVAEGVEDAETLQVLAELGCDLAQGYHIARPMPPADFVRFLSQRTAGKHPMLVGHAGTDAAAVRSG
jgi:diguanylate cyclase (GGDEF)-like protein